MDLADQLAPLLHEYFQDRECWNALTERFDRTPSNTCGKESLALQIRELIQAFLRKHGADFGYVALGGFAVLVERQIEDAAARDEWRKASPWDMYRGPFSDLRLGDAADREPDVLATTSRVSVGVPVMRGGKFVGAVHVFFPVLAAGDAPPPN